MGGQGIPCSCTCAGVGSPAPVSSWNMGTQRPHQGTWKDKSEKAPWSDSLGSLLFCTAGEQSPGSAVGRSQETLEGGLGVAVQGSGVSRHSLQASTCWLFARRVESSGGWEGAFIRAGGQRSPHGFFWKDTLDGVCFVTQCHRLPPGQVGFATSRVHFNQAQSP